VTHEKAHAPYAGADCISPKRGLEQCDSYNDRFAITSNATKKGTRPDTAAMRLWSLWVV
jgi:hypothetical protein